MAKTRNPRRKRVRRKLTGHSGHAPLAALAPVIAEKQIFSPIHQQVLIPQKAVDYRPTDKLVFVVLSVLAGAETVYDINHTLRVDEPLLRAFGYDTCADQSVTQQTLNASLAENVVQSSVTTMRSAECRRAVSANPIRGWHSANGVNTNLSPSRC